MIGQKECLALAVGLAVGSGIMWLCLSVLDSHPQFETDAEKAAVPATIGDGKYNFDFSHPQIFAAPDLPPGGRLTIQLFPGSVSVGGTLPTSAGPSNVPNCSDIGGTLMPGQSCQSP